MPVAAKRILIISQRSRLAFFDHRAGWFEAVYGVAEEQYGWTKLNDRKERRRLVLVQPLIQHVVARVDHVKAAGTYVGHIYDADGGGGPLLKATILWR